MIIIARENTDVSTAFEAWKNDVGRDQVAHRNAIRLRELDS